MLRLKHPNLSHPKESAPHWGGGGGGGGKGGREGGKGGREKGMDGRWREVHTHIHT